MPKQYTMIPERLIECRLKANINQEEFAEKLSQMSGMSIVSSNISLWETGKRSVPYKYVSIIPIILNVSQSYLMGETDDYTTNSSKNNYTIIPARLSACRIRAQLSQAEFAEKISQISGNPLATCNITLWETGRRKMPYKHISHITTVLNVSKSYLMGQTDDYNSNEEIISNENSITKLEIPYTHLYKFDLKPIYVEIFNRKYESQWGLYSMDSNEIVFIDRRMKIDSDFKANARLYLLKPYDDEYSSGIRKTLERKAIFEVEMVYVKMNTTDRGIKGLYNGWYHHNETKTALINCKGLVLPYDGIGISYNAYSVGEI